MVQKITWIYSLIIGTSCLFFLFSCDNGDTEYVTTTNFVYKNLLNENVEIKIYNESEENFKNYEIPANSEVIVSLSYEGPKYGVGSPFFYSISLSKVVIKFEGSNTCLVNYAKILDSKQYDNFNEEMNNQSDNTLIYNIDNEEVILASACN